jgi:hypothetical protein
MEQAIRVVRDTSNAALAVRDLLGLSRCWAPDYTVITSLNVRAIGRSTNLERLAMEFMAKPDLELIREPMAIRVFDAWGMAHEEGQWRAAWTEPDGRVIVGGSYCAKWQTYQDAGWLIEAELYVPTQCSGGRYCQRPLPVLRSPRPGVPSPYMPSDSAGLPH